MTNELKLGQIIEGEATRDAIHLAVIPLTAGENLPRASLFRLSLAEKHVALDGNYSGEDVVGIVDPFLTDRGVKKGQRFWGFLLPGTVTGMRHSWSHPAFDAERRSSNEHVNWLRRFCDKWNLDYDETLASATRDNDSEQPSGRYVTARGVDLNSKEEIGPEDYRLFWEHVESLSGKTFDDQSRECLNWTCSC